MGRPAISEAEFEKEQERIRDAAQNLFEQGGRGRHAAGDLQGHRQ